jgi:hypothetical protein
VSVRAQPKQTPSTQHRNILPLTLITRNVAALVTGASPAFGDFHPDFGAQRRLGGV